jgi:hypothetical protein
MQPPDHGDAPLGAQIADRVRSSSWRISASPGGSPNVPPTRSGGPARTGLSHAARGLGRFADTGWPIPADAEGVSSAGIRQSPAC